MFVIRTSRKFLNCYGTDKKRFKFMMTPTFRGDDLDLFELKTDDETIVQQVIKKNRLNMNDDGEIRSTNGVCGVCYYLSNRLRKTS